MEQQARIQIQYDELGRQQSIATGAIPYIHGVQSSHAREFWFPESRDCTCCKGFKLGCSCCTNLEACQNCAIPLPQLEPQTSLADSTESVLQPIPHLIYSLSGEIIDRNGTILSPSTFVGKYFGLFFSASWSPECRAFTRLLKDKYAEVDRRSNKKLEIVFVPYEHGGSTPMEYFLHTMPWKMVKGSQEIFQALEDRLSINIEELPVMMIWNDKGHLIDATLEDFLNIPFDKIESIDDYNHQQNILEMNAMSTLPETMRYSAHPHTLIKTVEPYGPGAHMECNLCQITLTECPIVSFHCKECLFDLHALCLLSDEYHQLKCSVPNIDQCIVCGEPYHLRSVEISARNKSGTDFACPNRCISTSSSSLSSRFQSLQDGKQGINRSLPPWNRTLLHSAVSTMDVELTWGLLKYGADPFLQDYSGQSPIDIARDILSSCERSGKILPMMECTTADLQADAMLSKARAIFNMLPKGELSLALDPLNLPVALPPMTRAFSEASSGIYTSPYGAKKPSLYIRGIVQDLHHRSPLSLKEIKSHFASRPPPIPTPILGQRSISTKETTNTSFTTLRTGTQPFTTLTLARLTESGSCLMSEETSNALLQLTLVELKNALLAGCESEEGGQGRDPSPPRNEGSVCTGCMDAIADGQAAYICPRRSCTGALCIECLYRSTRSTITSALYAVPMIRCPACRGRIPTYLWTHLMTQDSTEEDREALRIDDNSHVADYEQFIENSVSAAEEIFQRDERDQDESEYLRELVANSIQVLNQLLRTLGKSPKDLSETVGHSAVEGCTLLHIVTEAQRRRTVQVSQSQHFDDISNSVAYLPDISGIKRDEVLSRISTTVINILSFFYRFYPDFPTLLIEAIEEENEDEDSPAAPSTAGQLLFQKYHQNADSLLKILCGDCHEPVGLFISDINGYNLPTKKSTKLTAIDEFLQPLDNATKISALRLCLAFDSATLSPQSFISALSRLWHSSDLVQSQPSSSGEPLDPLVLSVPELDFFVQALVLLTDEERRLTAQLALLRTYPKIFLPCCGSPHCFMCKVKGHHEGQTCEEVQAAQTGTEAQYCPGCGVPTLRTEGCSRIQCVCGMAWEWNESGDGEEEEAEEWEDVEESEDEV
jgi:hypothetical protein